MQLKPVQEHYIQNHSHRDVCVKARQLGFSTGRLALDSHATFTNPFTKYLVVAHRDDSAAMLLQTCHRFYNNLPNPMKPVSDWKSREHIRFPKMDCLIHIDSAEAKTLGRSEDFNRVHLSEVAQWSEARAIELWSGISETVPEGGYITLESTPKGRGGLFYRIYQGAKEGLNGFKPFFYAWWWEPEYTIDTKPFELTNEEKDLKTYVSAKDGFELTYGQIAWRRKKIQDFKISIGEEYFWQEYPENDVDCWLAGEANVFDGAAIRRAMQRVCKPSIKPYEDLSIWVDAYGGHDYIIGVDSASGMPKGDFSVAAVVDRRNNEHVATLRGRIPPDLFARRIMELGKRYNNALIAVEKLGHGHTVLQVLLQSDYRNIYFHKEYFQGVIDVINSQPGWNTSKATRPTMIDNFNIALRNGDFITYSENLLNEAAGFIYVGQKAQAAPGEHDDELFAIMIAHEIRQSEPTIPITRAKVVDYA